MHCECCHYVDLKKITFCRELTCINKKLLCRWRIIQYRMKCFLFLFQPWLVKIALHYYLPIQFSWTQTDTSYLNLRLVIFKKKTTSGRRVLSKNGILWATVGSSSAIVFAEFDLFFSSADHVVSVGPGNNFFLRRWSISSVEAVVEESVDQPSIIAQPSKDKFFWYVVRRSVDIKAFGISAGRNWFTTKNWPGFAGLSNNFDISTDGPMTA